MYRREFLSQLFDAGDSPFDSRWMIALEEMLCVFILIACGAFGRRLTVLVFQACGSGEDVITDVAGDGWFVDGFEGELK